MINPIVSRSSLGSLLVCATLGCSGGRLDQPDSPVPAMMLQVRFAESPPAGTTEIYLGLSPIRYCPISDLLAQQAPPLDATVDRFRSQLFDPSVEIMEMPAWGGGNLQFFDCPLRDAPLVRFFQPVLSVLPSPIGRFPWTARDTIVAYTDEPVTFTPFGPTDEPIALGRGYSVLRRTCGTPDRPWHLQIVPAAGPVDFYPPFSPEIPQPFPPLANLLEQSERELLEGCGIAKPPVSLVKRVTFDRATSLAFSGNGTELLYLGPVDPTDATQSVPLRAMTVADGRVRQLNVVPQGRNLQTTSGGDTYVATGINVGSLGRVDPQADGSATIKILPIPGWGRVSPDGKWIVYSTFSHTSIPVTGGLWNVVLGAEHPVEFPRDTLGWSPGSLLVKWVTGTGQPGAVYELYEPSGGHMIERIVTAYLGSVPRLLWGPDGPISASTPTYWAPQELAAPSQRLWGASEERFFGLVLENPRDGSVSTVLDASAGMITYAGSAPGTALFWARKCLGLFETVCSFDLHRVTLPAGVDQIVAVGDSAAPVALSPSGDRLAIAARDGIYIRDLP